MEGPMMQPAAPRRALVALACLLGAFEATCQGSCKPPPSISTACWQHTGPVANDCCQGDSDKEPNDNVRWANPAPDATCDTGGPITGHLGGDVDAFRVAGPRCDGPGPTATLSTTDPTIRLCMFAACYKGKTGINGCPSGVPTHLPEGILGCCSDPSASPPDGGTTTVALDVNCDGDTQFGSVTLLRNKQPFVGYIVVDGASADQCSDYDVTYHF